MWRSTSLFFQISLLFVFALISFLAVALFYMKIQPRLESIRQYNVIVNAIGKMKQFNANIKEIQEFLEEENFHEISLTDYSKQKFITNTEAPKPNSFNINVIQDGNDIFITLRTMQNFIVYQDTFKPTWSKYYTITIIGVVILIVIYMTLISKLIPLNHIKHEIKAMVNNDTFSKITYAVENRDEIGELVREFNRSISKINALGESRTLFLRSIMHELKTPITKGRIIAEMVQDTKQKQKLCDVFERLNILIDEFARIEQLASRSLHIEKKEYLLTDVIQEVKRMLLIDPNDNNSIILHHTNDLIKADFSLFTLSIKNLVDNAIKYSTDSQVIIETTKCDLMIKNKGEPLKFDITEYFKPYFKNIKNPLSSGFGLGIYIVKTALEYQNLQLQYHYQDGYHIFTICNCIVESFCVLPTKKILAET